MNAKELYKTLDRAWRSQAGQTDYTGESNSKTWYDLQVEAFDLLQAAGEDYETAWTRVEAMGAVSELCGRPTKDDDILF